MANPSLGIFLHGLGAMSSALCYTPQKRVKHWSWQTYWLAQAAVCWLLLPILVAFFTTPNISEVLKDSPNTAIVHSSLLGLCYGIGGTAFGIAIRYLGFSITYAVSIGISSVLGTLLPPLLAGQLTSLVNHPGSSWIFAGIASATLGIAASGLAGWLRDNDHNACCQDHASHRNSLVGIAYAILAGVLSAFFGLALAAGQPLADIAEHYGAGQFQGNIVLVFACGGAFLSTGIICLFLHLRGRTLGEYIPSLGSGRRSALAMNFALATLTGALWYGQFLCYGVAHTFMGTYKFISWMLHMSMLVLFSALVGIGMREWRGCRGQTLVALSLALFLLLAAVGAIARGSSIGGI